MGARRQEGYLYEVEGSNGKPASFHIRYRVNAIVDGKQVRVQRSTKLCDRDAKFHSITGKAVKEKQAQFMLGIKGTSGIAPKEETVEGLWRTVYLPHIEETTKASTSPTAIKTSSRNTSALTTKLAIRPQVSACTEKAQGRLP